VRAVESVEAYLGDGKLLSQDPCYRKDSNA